MKCLISTIPDKFWARMTRNFLPDTREIIYWKFPDLTEAVRCMQSALHPSISKPAVYLRSRVKKIVPKILKSTETPLEALTSTWLLPSDIPIQDIVVSTLQELGFACRIWLGSHSELCPPLNRGRINWEWIEDTIPPASDGCCHLCLKEIKSNFSSKMKFCPDCLTKFGLAFCCRCGNWKPEYHGFRQNSDKFFCQNCL